MRLSRLAVISFLVAVPTAATEPKTEAAVVTADNFWLNAEMAGNGGYLDNLMLPGYVSVSADGKITSKAQIVAKARSRDKQDLARLAEQVAAWKLRHPVRPDVTIAGDTAILRWVTLGSQEDTTVSSSDVFLYRGGRWRAIYSQHTIAAK